MLDRALQGAVHFNTQAGYLLDKPGLPDHQEIQRELQTFVTRGLKLRNSRLARMGHIVFVRVFDPDSNIIAKHVDSNYTDIEAVKTYMDSSELWLPRDDEDWYEIARINTNPYVKIGVPLTNTRGEVVAHIDGVFAVSAEVISDVRRRALKTALIIIAIF